jgi:hypothetical protein
LSSVPASSLVASAAVSNADAAAVSPVARASWASFEDDELARAIGVSLRHLYRLRDIGLTDEQADQAATAFGRPPTRSRSGPAWYDDSGTPRQFLSGPRLAPSGFPLVGTFGRAERALLALDGSSYNGPLH